MDQLAQEPAQQQHAHATCHAQFHGVSLPLDYGSRDSFGAPLPPQVVGLDPQFGE
ncbi:MAG: hypothetical protein ACRDTT_31425 [Pseudonocardiaceae bacterium]